MAATSRKTMQLDMLQLNSLRFLTLSNTSIPSTLVLSANGDGTTSFISISSFTYTNISIPGQTVLTATTTNGTLNLSSMSSELYLSTNSDGSALNIGIPSLTSTIASTIGYALPSTLNKLFPIMPSSLYNLLTYPNINSTIGYTGTKGNLLMSTASFGANVTVFSSFQYNFSNGFSKYLNPNGSSRVFLEFYPNFTFSPVITPSSISSLTLYPEGNSSIKNVISLSSHLMYYNPITNINIPVIQSGVQQYININSSYPYGFSSFTNRPLSNSFIQPMQFELDSMATRSNLNFSLLHYVSDGNALLKSTNGNDVFRSGFERATTFINNNIGDKNSVFIHITNSGNQY